MNKPDDIIDDLRLLEPFHPGLWLVFIAGVILLIGLVLFLRRRYAARINVLTQAQLLQAQEDALAELTKIRSLIKPGNSLAYGIAVSGIIRRYIERRFGLLAPRRSTEEFLKEAAVSDHLSSDHRSLLDQFLSCCDFLKFARGQADVPELESLQTAATRFVSETLQSTNSQEGKS